MASAAAAHVYEICREVRITMEMRGLECSIIQRLEETAVDNALAISVSGFQGSPGFY